MPPPTITDAEAAALINTRGERPIKLRHLPGIMDAIAGAVRQHAADAVAPLQQRVQALERENAELKAAGAKSLADSFRGTWQPGNIYQRGNLAVWEGSLWLCMADNSKKPGLDGDNWRLIVKKGRDGKDAR